MPRCSFCKRNYEFPLGLTLILYDGNILYFCSSKCRKNQLKLKRDNKKVNWIRKDSGAETQSFEDAQRTEKVEKAEKAQVEKTAVKK
jgi:large subunit ribosomal protein L24e